MVNHTSVTKAIQVCIHTLGQETHCTRPCAEKHEWRYTTVTEITNTDRVCHEDKSPHGFAGESETLVNCVSRLWAEAGERASWLRCNPVTTGICSASPVKD